VTTAHTSVSHVLITRALGDCRELQSLLEGSGIRLRPFPVLRLVEHTDSRGWKKVATLLTRAQGPRPWLVLSSPRAVRFLTGQARERGLEAVLELDAAAVGPATARTAEAAGLHVVVIGGSGGSELAQALDTCWEVSTTAILAAAVHARPELPAALQAAGHTVVKLEVYEMRPTPPLELPPVGPADAVVLTSPRAAELYLQAVGGLPLPIDHWALGVTTRDACLAMGIPECRIPASPSMVDLASALRERHAV
jgi:uroporphyrinogen-III synthase